MLQIPPVNLRKCVAALARRECSEYASASASRLVLVLVMGLIGSFQIFDTVQIGYAGHPIPAVRVIYYYIYQPRASPSKMNTRLRHGCHVAIFLINCASCAAGSSDLA